MSACRPVLNFWLRTFEKPYLTRAAGPAEVRQSFERQARLFFYPPLNTHMTWRRPASGPEVLEISTSGVQPDRVIFYVHGGGFVFGSPNTHGAMVAQLAHRIGARAILPRYQLAPEAPFPAAINDVSAAWAALIASGVRPCDVIFGGDSAGGALIFALLGQLCETGGDLPGAVFGLSPLTDLSCSGASFRDNAKCEAVLPADRAGEMVQAYLSGRDPGDPLASPSQADFTGGPPVWLTVGDTEILRDDAHLLAEKLRSCGVAVTLEEQRDLPHVWPIFHNILPEARATLDTLAGWIRQVQEWPTEN